MNRLPRAEVWKARRPTESTSRRHRRSATHGTRARHRRLWQWVLALTLGGGFGTTQAEDWIYTTRPGDNLWNLTKQYTKSVRYVVRLQELNQVAQPRRLQPGTRLRFPLRWLKIQPAEAEVIAVAGAATVLRSGAEGPVGLALGSRLSIGDAVLTGGDGNVLLRFADGSTMAVRSDSEVIMDTLSVYGDTGMADSRLRLQRGRTKIKASPDRGPGSRFEIQTPAAVSAVRGTEFRVAADADQPVARTEVTVGRVAVSGGKRKRVVPENFGIVARAKEPLGRPIKLLPPPDGTPLPDLVRRVPVRLRWVPLAGAQSYRVEVATTEGFSTLIVDKRTSDPAASFDIERDGSYFLRLRGIDDSGLEGLNLLKPLIVDARPLPPVSVAPVADAKVRTAQPEFQWTLPVNATNIDLQVARDTDFTDLVIDEALATQTRFRPAEPLDEGRYFWRLATTAGGEVGPYGEVLSFRHVPPPPSPDAAPPEVSEEQAVFRWQRGEPDDRYRFQLARDSKFGSPVIDEILAESSYTVLKPRGGTYYVRIAKVDGDGVQGAFGEAQRFDVPTKPKWWLVPLIWLGMIIAL